MVQNIIAMIVQAAEAFFKHSNHEPLSRSTP